MPKPEAYPAAAAWHLAHGAHLAACLAVLGARGRQAVVQRDAGALLSALIVCGLEPHWLAPDAGLRVTAGALGAALDAAPGARAAIVGAGDGDVAALVEVAHAHGAALVVDAARPADAVAAIAGGADLVIAPHAGGGERFSRPGRMRAGGGAAAPRGGGAGGSPAGARGAVSGHHQTRRGAAALLHGADAERWLPAVAVERAIALAAGRAPVPVTPLPATVPGPTRAEAEPRRFTRALPAIQPGPTVCSPRAAWLAPQERVAPAAAVGRIAAEALTPDPPGVPAVLPGERLVPDVLATLRAVLDAGGCVHGTADRLATIAVVAAPGR